MADIPEESNVDTESDGIGLGGYENDSDGDHDEELEYYSDGDHDKDQDYVEPQAPDQTELDEEQDEVEEQDQVLETARKREKKVQVHVWNYKLPNN
jgi:hypothetical protein